MGVWFCGEAPAWLPGGRPTRVPTAADKRSTPPRPHQRMAPSAGFGHSHGRPALLLKLPVNLGSFQNKNIKNVKL